MGSFRVHIGVGSTVGDRFADIEALVDTGATYTWVPRNVLEQLGVHPSEERAFLLADGRFVNSDRLGTGAG
jgi:predicted aspartyl protease